MWLFHTKRLFHANAEPPLDDNNRINTHITARKADKASRTSHKNTITRASFRGCSEDGRPAHCAARPGVKERWPAVARPSRPAGSPCSAALHTPVLAPPSRPQPPRLALLFPHLINLSAKPLDTLHNMAPAFLGSSPGSFQYGSRTSRLVGSPTRVRRGSGGAV